MLDSAGKVINLLGYIEQVEKLKRKPAFQVPGDYFVAHQHELQGLPELQFNLQQDGDDLWLRFPRLQETAAPDPGDLLKPWVVLSRSPEKTPEIKQEVMFPAGPDAEPVQERLEDRPDVKAQFAWYVEYMWKPWSRTERPRRSAITLYRKLFALQQAITEGGAETPLEIVWGLGHAVWKKDKTANAVSHPLFTQGCSVTLNEQTLDLEVRPRDIEPKLELDCYAQMEIAGVRQLQNFCKAVIESSSSRLSPFDSGTYESCLRAAVGHLDPGGEYVDAGEQPGLPAPTENLKITGSWVIFGRKRSGDILLEDIRRLRLKLEDAASLPPVIQNFVEFGDESVRHLPEVPFRGLSTSNGSAGARELYFPMPYNDEQVSIIQKLENNDGVVVQGPPGTGKTHTIANVISHYLAQGKRVLVTARGESPLAVVQEKLPEKIRSLCVALLTDDRDGKKQFEHAIQTIASRVSSLNPVHSEKAIVAAENLLDKLHAKISHVDKMIEKHAEQQMRQHFFRGESVSAEAIARVVHAQAEIHQWFDDSPPEVDTLPVTEDHISSLRISRKALGSSLVYGAQTLPGPDRFPPWSEIISLHRDLVRADILDARMKSASVLPLVDESAKTYEKAGALTEFLDERRQILARVQGATIGWAAGLRARLTSMGDDAPLLLALKHACEFIQQLERTRVSLVPKAVHLPPAAELDEDFISALERLLSGKSAFALPFGKASARKIVGAVSVAGSAPRRVDDWKLVNDWVLWRGQARKAIAQWRSLAGEFGFDGPNTDVPEHAIRELAAAAAFIQDVDRLHVEFDTRLQPRVIEVFGESAAARLLAVGEPFVEVLRDSLQAFLDRNRLDYVSERLQEISRHLDGCAGPVVDDIREFLDVTLKQYDADEETLKKAWHGFMSELDRLAQLRPHFVTVEQVTALLEVAGAPRWAQRLRTFQSDGEEDALLPSSWKEAWDWRLAATFLDRIDAHHKLLNFFKERRALTDRLSVTYQELVADKTWLEVYKNSPDSVRQALQAYLNAVHAMGAGTGIRAVRYRKNAQDAMKRAYKAVPCWVLPHWRVSETIPAELGLFDLVIVDEASQSDIWALPVLLRGKKLLVVGDHKQVSPSAIGAAEERVRELFNRFLSDQPHGSEMTPEKSIYDLARVVFAGSSVMLKEHFRSVPAIIEYSNREFYEGEIRPLRVPKANERLDPPLVDVFVKGGARKGDVNKAEAMAIVQEISAILVDEQFSGRTIGVVTLLGTEQAAHIYKLIQEHVSQDDIVARKISVGPPALFQGRERDIMMVSMVIAPGDRAAQSKADMFQRFNVALSRARDRMYLFRSVTLEDVKPDTLNGRVIKHFTQPFMQDAKKVETLRERCESGFELEMYDELVKRGYRVHPQVPAGGYRIDFVVEGELGRRLAIECDGDRFHGPERWADDMVRQRVLERAGWTFWRCFASSFVRRRDEVLADLFQTLSSLGIEPVGSDSVDNTSWVTHREVDPFGVEDAVEVD